MKKKVLIMGIGNWLMQDEGIGVHVARSIDEQLLPPDVDVVDGGTGGFHLLEYFQNYENVILIDATLDGSPEGTIRLIKPKYASDFPQAMSTHDIGLKDLVSALQLLGFPVNIHLFVISIKSIQEQGVEVSPAIAGVIPIVREKVMQLAYKLLEKANT